MQRINGVTFFQTNDNHPESRIITIKNGLTDVASSGDEIGGGLLNDYRSSILNNVAVTGNNIAGEVASSVGGGMANRGDMPPYDCTIANNHAHRGGGIFNAGLSDLKMYRSTVHSNTAGAGAGITLYGTFALENCTVYNTVSVPYSVGGISVDASSSGSIKFSTISGNRGYHYGGILVQTGAAVSMGGAILSDNIRSSDSSLLNCSGAAFTIAAYNLEDGNSCGLSEPLNMINTDPMLGSLRMDGGLPPTLPLRQQSPAMDAVTTSSVVIEDQRRKHRPKGAYPADIGAYEYYGPFSFPVKGPNGKITIISM